MRRWRSRSRTGLQARRDQKHKSNLPESGHWKGEQIRNSPGQDKLRVRADQTIKHQGYMAEESRNDMGGGEPPCKMVRLCDLQGTADTQCPGDISTHFLSTECVMPNVSEEVRNSESTCNDASTHTLVPVGIQRCMTEEETVRQSVRDWALH